MQAIKTVALRKAESASRRIREQAAWFYLRHMNINEDTSPSTVFHALLTRKERESLPAPQGEKEKRYGRSFVLVQPCSKHSFMIR